MLRTSHGASVDGPGIEVPMGPRGRLVTFLVLGACVATGCDALHVRAGTLSYPEPALPTGQAWFVFPGFVVAFSWMAAVYAGALRWGGEVLNAATSASAGSARPFAETLVAFAAFYALSAYGHDDPAMLAALFYGSFVVRLVVTYDRLWAALLAAMLAVGGTLGEGLMTQAGWVRYAHDEVFGVPWWLGGLYMHGALALREGMRWVRGGSASV